MNNTVHEVLDAHACRRRKEDATKPPEAIPAKTTVSMVAKASESVKTKSDKKRIQITSNASNKKPPSAMESQ